MSNLFGFLTVIGLVALIVLIEALTGLVPECRQYGMRRGWWLWLLGIDYQINTYTMCYGTCVYAEYKAKRAEIINKS